MSRLIVVLHAKECWDLLDRGGAVKGTKVGSGVRAWRQAAKKKKHALANAQESPLRIRVGLSSDRMIFQPLPDQWCDPRFARDPLRLEPMSCPKYKEQLRDESIMLIY